MPPPTPYEYRYRWPEDGSLAPWVRGTLAGMALGLVAVFAVAFWLNPYQPDGSPRTLATHQQLGLPPCTFVIATGVPCPACGMTTSFALLVRGDVASSLRANWVGTLLASFCLVFIPWAVLTIVRGRPVLVRSLEKAFIGVLVSLLVLMIARWGVVLWLVWSTGGAS